MNNVLPNKTRRLAIKTAAKLFILVLVALACIATPLTAFACDRPTFATILKGFCQAFRADLGRVEGLTSKQFNEIINGNSVKGVLEKYKGLDDPAVEAFERNEITIASSDFIAMNRTYAPGACGLQGRDIQQDASDFQSYFNSQEYAGLDIGFIDSMFTDAVRAAGRPTTNTINDVNHNPSSKNVVEPKFHTDSTAINGGPCDDTLVKGRFDRPTPTTFYNLTVGGAPEACNESVTWNFSNRTVGKNCNFHISPLSQNFTLNFIDSNGNQIDSFTTVRGSVMSRQENNVKKVELDFSSLSNITLQLGGIWYNCQ